VSDPHAIETVDALRAVIGELNPATQMKVGATIDQFARAYIERSPFLVLSTSDGEGRQDVSPKGDGPGFAVVESDTTLLIPDRKGNRLVYSLQNILANPHVGVLFLVPGTNETLRVNGRAALTADPAICARLAARGQPALLAIRVTVEECFFHCAKAFLRAQLWQPEHWPAKLAVSFGKMMAPKFGGDQQMADMIDTAIEEDYRTNL
jgi:PPOX class probable FMN-dependent enzyme